MPRNVADGNAVDTESITKHERQVHRLMDQLIAGDGVLASRPHRTL
jgi:hypothetical protein